MTGNEGCDCRTAVTSMHDYLDGEAEADTTDQVDQHLRVCPPCARVFSVEQAFRALVRRSCTPPVAPPALRSQIMARITDVRIDTDGSSEVSIREVRITRWSTTDDD